MNRELIATTSKSIYANPKAVWNALINPEMVRKYMHGAELRSNFALHDPITFTGEWEGKPYVDKGIVLDIMPERMLRYSYWSPLAGTDDFEDNYSIITYHIAPFDDETTLTITQDNLSEEADVVKAEGNWMKVLGDIKRLLENDAKHVL